MQRSEPIENDRPALGRTAAAWKAVHLIAYAEERGLPSTEVIDRFGLDRAALSDVDGRVPLTTIVRMWNELPGLIGDPDMPLHVLLHAKKADPTLAVLIFLSSPTLGDAIRRMVRYERIGYDVADEPVSEFVEDGDRAHVVLHHERSAVVPPTGAVLYTLAATIVLARMATKTHVAPLALTLRHPTPRRPEEYRALFGCPITFDANRDRMTLSRDDLGLPHPDASRNLLAIVERHANDALAQLPLRDDFLTSVRRAIRSRLPDGQVALSHLARPLGISARTLQRRLTAEGTSLRSLLDDERRGLALHHIQNPRTSLAEIAFLLGFADQSAFTRAFSRWTSRSPTEYRRTLA